MLDSYNRNINYLRISVTDRCNQRCEYCMPAEGVPPMKHEDILSFEEIIVVVRAAVALGVNKVRLTGGEPLVRRHLVDLVTMLSAVDGIDDLAMTTNAVLLSEFAAPLKAAGLHRINISLDALDPERYRQITRCGDVAEALAGIQAAQDAGFEQIKLNCVIEQSADEPDAQAVAAFARQHGYTVRFIRKMDLSSGQFWKVIGGEGGDCPACNRLRLSSDGWIYPCLFNDQRFSVRELGAHAALLQAVEHKPQSGHVSTQNQFYTLGG